jgi:RimJ/RimL family protein N-acetyltransferase
VSLPTLSIRPYRQDEFERACEIRELTQPDARERMKKRIETSGTWDNHFMHLAIELHDELVGDIQLRHCEFSMPEGVAEIGIDVVAELRGRGIGSQALKLSADYLFTNGYHRITGSTAYNNFGMQRAFEKAGWEKEGISRNLFIEDGEGIDYIVYAITHLEGKK